MSEITGQTREQVEDIAADLGVEVFFAEADELFIDLDDGAVIKEDVKRTILRNGVSIISEMETTSLSGNGTHVYWHINKHLPSSEAAALQAALGSDPIREALTILTRDFSALFETKDEAKHVKRWRAAKEEYDKTACQTS